MKAWRKHNMICADKKTPQWKLKTKVERRTQFQAEVTWPCKLLVAMLQRVGISTPQI